MYVRFHDAFTPFEQSFPIHQAHAMKKTAIEQLLSTQHLILELQARHIGVLCHAASVDRHGVHLLQILSQAQISPKRIFSPEHGLWATAQDMESVEDTFDIIAGARVTSLYGHSLETLSPSAEALNGLDLILIDLQDVGARYYTYVYTAWLLARASLQRGMRVIVLDRPNPIDGATVEGNLVSEGFRSFVGMRSLMTRHGMTMGELLWMWSHEDALPERSNLEIVRMQDYDRHAYFDALNLCWVLPSPNMPAL